MEKKQLYDKIVNINASSWHETAKELKKLRAKENSFPCTVVLTLKNQEKREVNLGCVEAFDIFFDTMDLGRYICATSVYYQLNMDDFCTLISDGEFELIKYLSEDKDCYLVPENIVYTFTETPEFKEYMEDEGLDPDDRDDQWFAFQEAVRSTRRSSSDLAKMIYPVLNISDARWITGFE